MLTPRNNLDCLKLEKMLCRYNVYDHVKEYWIVLREKGQRKEQITHEHQQMESKKAGMGRVHVG